MDEAGNRTGVQCLYCEFTTRLPSNMPGHVNAKHLGKSVKCPECSFTTFYPKNLACHVKKLHGRSTRQCFMERCKFRFFQACSLQSFNCNQTKISVTTFL